METRKMIQALKLLRPYASAQQLRTIRGQILAGDVEGAARGIEKIKKSRMEGTDEQGRTYRAHGA